MMEFQVLLKECKVQTFIVSKISEVSFNKLLRRCFYKNTQAIQLHMGNICLQQVKYYDYF